MHPVGRRAATFLSSLALVGLGLAGAAFADEPRLAVPHPWQMGMQAPGSPVEQRIASLNDAVTVIMW